MLNEVLSLTHLRLVRASSSRLDRILCADLIDCTTVMIGFSFNVSGMSKAGRKGFDTQSSIDYHSCLDKLIKIGHLYLIVWFRSKGLKGHE